MNDKANQTLDKLVEKLRDCDDSPFLERLVQETLSNHASEHDMERVTHLIRDMETTLTPRLRRVIDKVFEENTSRAFADLASR